MRRWFAEHALLSVTGRLAEYILVAPTPELRNMFVKLIVFICHFAISDEPLQTIQTPADSLCEQILLHVLYLLKTDVPENGKHLAQYFSLFTMYASLNVQQKQQLLKVSSPPRGDLFPRKDLTRFERFLMKKIVFIFIVECSGHIYASCIR